MNVYPFECQSCEHAFEKTMSISQYEKHGRTCNCPKCGKEAKRAYIGSVTFDWRGKWFATKGEY